MERHLIIIAILVFSACKQGTVKVIAEEHFNGKPKIIRYFNSIKDAETPITVEMKNGKGTVNKPLTFLEEGYYENGKLQYRGHYVLGQTSGLWEYFYKTGINNARSYYKNGISSDSVLCWFSSGQLKRTFIEVDTIKRIWHGVDYSENGTKIIESNLILDNLGKWIVDGKWTEWHANGQKKLEANMKNNWSVGKWQEWDEKGALIEESETPFNITF